MVPSPISRPDTLVGVDVLIRAGLEKFSDLWFARLIWSSVIVAVGIFFEGPEVFHEVSGVIRPKLHMGEPQKEKKSAVVLCGLIGWLLVAGGVAGEGLSEGFIWKADGILRSFNNMLVAEATKQAGDAAQSAKTAHEELRTLSEEAAHIRDSAASARASAKAAEIDAGNAQQKVDDVAKQANDLLEKYVEAENKLEQERNERIELEKSLMPRRLFLIGYADKTSNLDVLKPLSGTELIVESIPDFEARQAASAIVSILESAHLQVAHTAITEEPVLDGVTVDAYLGPETADERQANLNADQEVHSKDLALRIDAFLWANGWKKVALGYSQHGKLKPNVLRIRVGFKPAPFFDTSPFPKKALDDIEAKGFSRYATPIDRITTKINFLVQAGGNPFPRPDK
jgi:hypothetical protein